MIEFDQLKTEIKHVDFETVRTDADTYFEAVLTQEHLSEVILRLDRALGMPVWPSKNKLSPRIQKSIEGFGGIREDQTLYFGEGEGIYLVVMLWPWQDGNHITLKIAKK